ncbi:MAG: hypothetical protein IT303_20510 [Dehalococcoidia bacterium]|nr:hypothetical protein [Dehalococcoidia bacterium]
MNSDPAPTNPKLPFELQQGEFVVKFARRHVVFLAWQLAKVVVLALVPVAAVLVLVQLTAGLGSTAGRIALVVAAIWLLYWLVRGYFTWYRYNNDLWVITNQRIIDSTKFHWFHQRMASADLINVEDLSISKEGVLPTMFNFGNVLCQTSGEKPNFVLSGIPEPSKMLATVDSARDAARRELTNPATRLLEH